jgi:hypothetical protein
VVRCLMDQDGDGQVSLPELVSAIKEAYTARELRGFLICVNDFGCGSGFTDEHELIAGSLALSDVATRSRLLQL